jgi:enoyl-CoA hydratase
VIEQAGVIERADVGDIAVVRLAAGKVNALDVALVRAVTGAFAELDASAVRGVVLTGAGRAFSAGVDLWQVATGGADYVREFLPALVDCFEAVFDCGKPVVAAVNGHAIAGGCVLASCCDHRVMAAGAGRIGVTELAVGVPFPTSALEILAYTAGPEQARRAVFGAATYPPEAAVGVGLADDVVPPEELLPAAVAAATRLARIPADTYRFTKQQSHASVRERLARRRPVDDPQTLALWLARVADGSIGAYMRQVTAKP